MARATYRRRADGVCVIVRQGGAHRAAGRALVVVGALSLVVPVTILLVATMTIVPLLVVAGAVLLLRLAGRLRPRRAPQAVRALPRRPAHGARDAGA